MDRRQEVSNPITVIIVDDQLLLVEALKLVLGQEPDLQVIGQAGSIADGLDEVKRIQPAVVLLGLNLPGGDRLDMIPHIRQASPRTKIIVLTNRNDETTLLTAFDRGANGFTSKDRSLQEVVETIRRAAAGENSVPTDLLLEMLRRLAPMPARTAARDLGEARPKLTRREREILTYLAEGMSGAQIAAKLSLSPQTVRTIIRNLMEKLEVHSRLEAVAYVLRNGLIASPG